MKTTIYSQPYALISCLILLSGAFSGAAVASAFAPGERVLVEAHNAYPMHGLWRNRLDRALATGFPVAVELDLAWHDSAETGGGRLVVSHGPPFSEKDPTLKDYFFERVRPVIVEALESGNTGNWPLITLNINDIRSNRREPFDTVWELTGEYESWLCTAEKGVTPDARAQITVAPILVVSSGGRLETDVFYDQVAPGEQLRIFGMGSRDDNATNFRRWINYPWSAVEPEGQRQAGAWTTEKAERLVGLVQDAHERGYWIRFYTLNGHGITEGMRLGLNPFYNFGDIESGRIRWRAAFEAGVDFIATDQIQRATKWLEPLR